METTPRSLRVGDAPRVLNARPDTPDFRDKLYEPTLVEVLPERPLDDYLRRHVPVLDQGTEGACTGYALATVAHYLLGRLRGGAGPVTEQVSPHMIYELAKRYDEWPGEDYEGSSARGAMKAWHKHGLCREALWPKPPAGAAYTTGRLTTEVAEDGTRRPLGAYYRVNHKDLVAMHSALTEVGVLYVTSLVHAGWGEVDADGRILLKAQQLGGHAFVIVAYDEEGFWIQNSWGRGWGRDGFGHLSYDDWLLHGTDVWVARLGAPVAFRRAQTTAIGHSAMASKSSAYTYCNLRPHIVSIGNEGRLRGDGTFGNNAEDVADIFAHIEKTWAGWQRKRLLLYAHGGLVDEASAVQRVADYREALLQHEVYPLAFIWKTDYWTTLSNMLQDAVRRRRPEGVLGAAADFMLDRLDDTLEPLARLLTGKASWDEMKENALASTRRPDGGARCVLGHVQALAPEVELHVAAHSAGAIFMAPFVQRLTTAGPITRGTLQGQEGVGRTLCTCTLWAPACTLDLFKTDYLPAILEAQIQRFALFTLTDAVEQDDHCAHVYHKSLLYLVSHAFEERPRIPLVQPGVPLLGLARALAADPELTALFEAGSHAEWILSPNDLPEGTPGAARAQHHGDFDDDHATVLATLARILADTDVLPASNTARALTFQRSRSALRDRRRWLQPQ